MTAKRMIWQYIETRDHRVMRQVNRWRAPRWLRVWMIWSSRLGDGWIWYSIGISLLLFGGDLRFAAFAASASAEAATVALFRFMKNASKRKRPCQLEAHCWAKILPPDQFSFPSGHAMSAFAIAVPLCIFYPQLQAALVAHGRAAIGEPAEKEWAPGSFRGTEVKEHVRFGLHHCWNGILHRLLGLHAGL